MNKTILIATSIVALALIVICLPIGYCYIHYLKTIAIARTNNINTNTVQTDKFTNCIQVTMSESRQSGKIIDAEKAKDICIHTKDIDPRKL